MPATDWIVEIVKILVVPLIVSWAATRLGVRRGLEQAKRERAFDRQPRMARERDPGHDPVLRYCFQSDKRMGVQKRIG